MAASLPYSDFLNLVKYSARPLTMRFCKPDKITTKLKSDDLPVKKIILESLEYDRVPKHFPSKEVLEPISPPVPRERGASTSAAAAIVNATMATTSSLIASTLLPSGASTSLPLSAGGNGLPPPTSSSSTGGGGNQLSSRDLSPRLNRQALFADALNQTGKTGRLVELNEELIRKLSHGGVPENSGFRSQIWMLLLGYLPYKVSEWDHKLQVQRDMYKQFVKEFWVDPPPLEALLGVEGARSALAHSEDSIKAGGKRLVAAQAACSLAFAREEEKEKAALAMSERSKEKEGKKKEVDRSEEDELLSMLLDGDTSGTQRSTNKKNIFGDDEDVSLFSNKVSTSGNLFGDSSSPSGGSKGSNKAKAASKNLFGDDDDDFVSTVKAVDKNIDKKKSSTLKKGEITSEPSGALLAKTQLQRYLDDANVRLDIAKDIERTHPDMHFFAEEPVLEMMERILLIFAKLNPGIMYVQGMNELLAPLLYVFSNDSVAGYGFSEHLEADTFFCFSALMSEFRELFMKTSDKSVGGIMHYIEVYSQLLQVIDPQVWNVLRSQGIEHSFYSFRWFTTLLTREFMLPDVLRLWDSFFADVDRRDFLVCFCNGMVMHRREDIVNGTFSSNLDLLQHYPSTDLHILLDCMNRVKAERAEKEKGGGGGGSGGKLEERLKEKAGELFGFINDKLTKNL